MSNRTMSQCMMSKIFLSQWLHGCRAICLCMGLLSLAACTVPANSDETPEDTSQDGTSQDDAARPAPRMSRPLPPIRVDEPPRLDYSCSADADCAVKNVGNCCGAMPACVNKDSPTDPDAVQAQCAQDGRMGVCGFREISACSCNAGKCEAAADSTLNVPSVPAD